MALVERPGRNEILLAIGLMQGPLGEASTNVLLVARVNVSWIVSVREVDGHSHTGMWDIKGFGLGLADLSPTIPSCWIVFGQLEIG